MRPLKKTNQLRASALIATGVGLGLLLNVVVQWPLGVVEMRAGAEEKATPTPAVTNAQPDMSAIGGLLPDQAHAMTDVGYHFANLWFAAEKENWPLAKYYLDETRSHLNWAVRIHPVRTTPSGGQVNLKGILQAIDNTFLTAMDSAITNQDTPKFQTAYRQTMDGCYACHQACQKTFLRPQIPSAPSATIIDLDPNATSPK
jgi:hypothetical protein